MAKNFSLSKFGSMHNGIRMTKVGITTQNLPRRNAATSAGQGIGRAAVRARVRAGVRAGGRRARSPAVVEDLSEAAREDRSGDPALRRHARVRARRQYDSISPQRERAPADLVVEQVGDVAGDDDRVHDADPQAEEADDDRHHLQQPPTAVSGALAVHAAVRLAAICADGGRKTCVITVPLAPPIAFSIVSP